MGLTDADELQRLVSRAQLVELPPPPRRRTGEERAFQSALTSIQGDLAVIHRHATEGDEVEGDLGMYPAHVELSLEMASLLFAAGAPHGQWRWWAARAASALLTAGDPRTAACWAAIAHDEPLMGRLPLAPAPGPRPSAVVWWLATVHREADLPVEPSDEVDAAWLRLARSIPAADHATTGTALRTITEFWLAEDEDWDAFHPRSYPDFEPELNAAAALAAQSGWEPAGWPPDAREFLEPGLADGSPS
jgi:hypothetical protein